MLEWIEKELIVSSDRPFESCHASHLAFLPNGDTLAVWFAGSREGAGDVAIWGARKRQGRWSEPYVLAAVEELPHWNPVLFKPPGGELILFYKTGRLIKEWSTLTMVSADNGVTWSEPAELVKGDRGGRGPVRNKPIVLSDGAWLAPASTEDGAWRAFADRSDDRGKSWRRSGDISIGGLDGRSAEKHEGSEIPVSEQSFYGRGVIQPTLWESAPGCVHMLLRSTEGRIYRSDSQDGGRTWCDAYPTPLPNNNSGIDLVKLDNGTLVLACNPVGANWGPRTPLVLYTSSDNGSAWNEELVLESEEGEYSYPAIVAEGSELGITYTWKRENIAFVRCIVRLEP